ncbi:hypothetical protein FACS1894180_4200 [Bacteroidia bacterium]|nr:hypothetical protein FACS1894180_4200 [Bacteroidia bacterium]
MKKKINFSSVLEKLALVVKRFPVSILLVCGFACLLFCSVNNSDFKIPFNWQMFFLIGTFITVTATLWLENFKICLWRYAATVCIAVLWLLFCIFLPKESENVNLVTGLQLFIIGIIAFVSMFFISFLQKNKDLPFWNFSKKTVLQFAVASLFAGVLFGGISLAALAIEQLFDVVVKDKVYGNIAISCFSLFAPIYFLANMPDKIEKFSEEINFNLFLKILGLYILTPILGIYLCILYGYLFKILLAWELPNGWVSWLVSILSIGGLLIISILYPLRLKKDDKVIVFISRYFGLLILPLLVLMSIGIFRRISEHGITINRLYVLTLNLWFYGIYIYLFIVKTLKIKWIYISFALVLLLVSVGPWKFTSTTKNIMTEKVEKVLNNKVLTDLESGKQYFATLDSAQREEGLESLKYLYKNYGMAAVQPFFKNTIDVKYAYDFLQQMGYYDTDEIIERKSYSYSSKYPQTLPNQYNSFIYINKYGRGNAAKQNINYSIDNQDFVIEINTLKGKKFVFPYKKIAKNLMKTQSESSDEVDEIICKSDDYEIFINTINFQAKQDSIEYLNALEGILFFNK